MPEESELITKIALPLRASKCSGQLIWYRRMDFTSWDLCRIFIPELRTHGVLDNLNNLNLSQWHYKPRKEGISERTRAEKLPNRSCLRCKISSVPPSYFLMHTLSRWSLLRAVPVNCHFLQSGLSPLEFSVPRFWIWNCWIGKEVPQGCILSPCLFNLYAEYIMRNAGLDEAQAGIKIARRNINNLRYADNTTLWQKMKRNYRASWWKWNRRVKKLA